MGYRKTNGDLEREGLSSYCGVMRTLTAAACICFVSVVKGGTGMNPLVSRKQALGSQAESVFLS